MSKMAQFAYIYGIAFPSPSRGCRERERAGAALVAIFLLFYIMTAMEEDAACLLRSLVQGKLVTLSSILVT